MVVKKLYKHRGKILSLVIIAGIAVYVATQFHVGNHIDPEQVHHTYSGLSYIQDQKVIDKDLVLKSLAKTHQIVGNEGHATKTYIYTDSMFKDSGWIKDALGRRTLEVTAEVFFKTGINIPDLINDDSLRVFSNTIHIKLPREVLISLDIPFDKLTFRETNGWMRSSLSLEEKQMIYTEIRKIVETNIMNDESIKVNTYEGVKSGLQLLLSKIENCNSIVFSPRLE